MRTFDRILGIANVSMGVLILTNFGETPGVYLNFLIGPYLIWKSVHGRY